MNIQHFDDKALLFMHTEDINLLAPLLFFPQHIYNNILHSPEQTKFQSRKYYFSGALKAIFAQDGLLFFRNALLWT